MCHRAGAAHCVILRCAGPASHRRPQLSSNVRRHSAHQSMFSRAAAFLVLTLNAPGTLAACVLPEPDGGDNRPSPANLHGQIKSIFGSEVVVQQARTRRLVRVRLPDQPEIYSAFGGDGSIQDLAPGQTVWVWFVDCTWPRDKIPVSAYFQIYSRDPKDKP